MRAWKSWSALISAGQLDAVAFHVPTRYALLQIGANSAAQPA